MNDDFRYIAAIAEHGSISRAARAMHISQPALSQRLKRLESKLGASLFDRTAAPLAPTPSGEVFIKYAKRAIAAEDSMRREVFSVARNNRRRLRVGVSMARANTLLARPIVSFYGSHKGCTIELLEMATLDQMHKLFLGDEIDCALFTPISPDPGAYETEVLCRERLQVVASSDFRVPALEQSSSGKVMLRKLEGVPFVLPSCGPYFDPLINRLIDSARVQLDVVVRDCSADLALSLVRDGLGISIVPSTWVFGMKDLRSFGLADVEAGNVLRYIRRCDRVPSCDQRLFMDNVREWISSTGL